MERSPPALVNVRAWAPCTVPLKVIPPGPIPVFIEVSAPSVIGPAKEIAAVVVLIDPLKLTDPLPDWVRAPPTLIAPAAVLVKLPPLAIVRLKGPPPVVVIAPPRTIEFVETEMPEIPVVLSAPLKVVVPVPVVCVIDAAEIACVFTLPALLTVIAPTGTIAPTA